jgi:hypothetical protein
MKNYYTITFLLTLLFTATKSFAYDDYDYDEDDLSMADVSMLLIFGGGILFAGFLIGQLKPLEGFGRVVMIIGAIIGGIGLLNIALMILSWAISTAVTLALYVGGLFVAGYILYSLYNWLFASKAR